MSPIKVVQINSVCGSGSTGKICVAISEMLTSDGVENYILHAADGCSYSLGVQYMTTSQVKFQALKAKLFGSYGFQSKSATRRLIRQLDEISPDIVQLHNLHGHNVHLGMLFSYLKAKKIKTFWTFHDCFAFTSYCMFFDMVKCDQWQISCEKCPQRKRYSWFVDRSKYLYKIKKKIFSGLDLTIITPSQWLADLTKKSFLRNYSVRVINNGIDLSVFFPRKTDFRAKHGISSDQRILLGVANRWEPRKGLDVFIRLAETLDKNKFKIVLVGTDSVTDKKLPPQIISIHRTVNQKELAEIYSAADYFVNPTREDNFPTVNIEALACGTPVITFDTGGSSEIITELCGISVKKNDFETLYSIISNDELNYLSEECVNRAKKFNQNEIFRNYVELYYNL